jgi:hypothetical protein
MHYLNWSTDKKLLNHKVEKNITPIFNGQARF